MEVTKENEIRQDKKNWSINFKLNPGTYYYKYYVDNDWTLNKN